MQQQRSVQHALRRQDNAVRLTVASERVHYRVRGPVQPTPAVRLQREASQLLQWALQYYSTSTAVRLSLRTDRRVGYGTRSTTLPLPVRGCPRVARARRRVAWHAWRTARARRDWRRKLAAPRDRDPAVYYSVCFSNVALPGTATLRVLYGRSSRHVLLFNVNCSNAEYFNTEYRGTE